MTTRGIVLSSKGDYDTGWRSVCGYAAMGTLYSTYRLILNGDDFIVVASGGSGTPIALGVKYSDYKYVTPVKATVLGANLNDGIWTGSSWFVLAGASGYSSTDGRTWTSNSSYTTAVTGTTGALRLVKFGSRIVAVGAGACVTSDDQGVTWTSRSTSFAAAFGATYAPYSMCWNGSLLFAVGASGACASSTDGITWTARPELTAALGGTATSYTFYDVANNGSRFVVVGYISTTPVAAYSDNGTSWNVVSNFSSYFPTNAPKCLAYANGVWIVAGVGAGGTSGAVCRSTDNGVTWSSAQSLTYTTSGVTSIQWAGNKFIVIGYYGKSYTSTDGITWTENTFLSEHVPPASTTAVMCMIWDGNRFIASGGKGVYISSSTDGENWTRHSVTGVSFLSTNQIALSLATDRNGGYVIGGNGGYYLCYNQTQGSIDSWAACAGVTAIFTSSVTDILWTGNRYLAVCANGKCGTSTTGSGTWTEVASFTTAFGANACWRVVKAGNIIVAVGASGKCATSTDDGVTWTVQAGLATAIGAVVVKGLAWDGKLIVATGPNVCATSPDGVNWTTRFGCLGGQFLIWTGSMFISSAASGSWSVSLDGITWSSDFTRLRNVFDLNLALSPYQVGCTNGNKTLFAGSAGSLVVTP